MLIKIDAEESTLGMEMEIVEGGSVYYQRGKEVSVFVKWDDLPTDVQEAVLKFEKQNEQATVEFLKSLDAAGVTEAYYKLLQEEQLAQAGHAA